jgi:DNA-binding SARP family transcriptional activator/tetratricopeptide (TPR) repeat protein
MIVLRALGIAEIETAVTTLTPSQEIVFAAALYLVLERGRRVSRAALASLLWPHVAERTRAHRLRQTILQLKKLGVIVCADRDNLQLLQHDAQSDVDELSADDAPPQLKHESLGFLPGYSPTFSEVFRDWVDARREETHALVTKRLVTELNTARSKGDWLTCDRFARQCLKLDPFNESAVLAQAEASAMRGAKTQAIQILDRYLVDVGSDNPNLRLSASVLRKRITDRIPERAPITVRECAFVGRDRETETLTTELLAARRGRGGARLVRGEAGIGKSRLASELIKFAMLEGVQTIRTACRRSDIDRPLSVFVDFVPQLSELRGALGCSQETMSVLKGLTEFDGRASFSSLSVDDSMSAHARMRAALFDLLDAVADERSVLVVVDDVQWVDASSVRLLTELLPWARTRKLFFVMTERPGASELASHFSPDDLRMLPLGPLRPEFGEAIMTEVLRESPRPTSSELIQRLLSVGEGNPFFLQELGNHWLETGKQRGSPPSITAIIDERLARLSDEALLVLQACAVLDVNASIERVEGVLEYQSHVLLSAIQELSVAGMLRGEVQTSPESTEQLTVGHDLISTAALGRLASAALAFLNRRAGTVLERETLGDGARTAILWACAFHWRHAGDRERAFRAACSCAEHLLEVGLTQDAARAFERSLDYCVSDEQRLLILSRLAICLQMCGRWEESKGVLHKSRQLQAKSVPNANTHDDVEFALFEAQWRASLQRSSLLDDLKACAGSNDASVTHRLACGLLGLKIAVEENQLDAMEDLYLTIVSLTENSRIAPTTRLEAEMIYHSTCGDMGKAEEAADQLRRAVRDEPDLRIRARALLNVGIAYRHAGRAQDAEAVLLEHLDYTLAHGLLNRTSFGFLALARVYLAAGNLPRTRDTLQKLEALAGDDQDHHLAGDRLYMFARLALDEGNIEEAAERYAELAPRTSSSESTNRHAALLALGIQIGIQQYASIERLRRPVAELETAHLQNRSTGSQDFEAHALALGLRYCGEPERALLLLGEYVTAYRRDKGAIPKQLSDLLRELRGSFAISPTCGTDSLFVAV